MGGVKKLFRWFGLLFVLVLCFVSGFLMARLQRGPIVLGQDAVVVGVPASHVKVELKKDAGIYLDIQPIGVSRAAFIFYPGGLVRPQAYEWLGIALSQVGIRTIIPEMPFDLAVFSPDRASKLLQLTGLPDTVLLGGHSLGGAMAARYALKHAEQLDGLILMGAFSAKTDDLSSLLLPTLVLAAEHDGLATVDEIRSSLSRLPADAEFELVPGSVHSFFGRYGSQQGDGLATVSRTDAEPLIIEKLKAFLEPF